MRSSKSARVRSQWPTRLAVRDHTARTSPVGSQERTDNPEVCDA